MIFLFVFSIFFSFKKKGSPLNISQMVALVGQQILGGARISDGFTHRALPHFERSSKTPQSRGFVESSFFSGLVATEFFFHAMAGREGLIDTAVKTAETGYMQRRLIKVLSFFLSFFSSTFQLDMQSLEDLETKWDLSVRDSSGRVIQFLFGGDGLDPLRMERGIDGVADLDDVWRCALRCADGSGAVLSRDAALERVGLISNRDRWSGVFADEVAKSLTQGVVSELVLDAFLLLVSRKFARARIEPGTSVGALCSQSVGEPATQMTLKTFHFAGIGANITLGVPRLTELINASANPKTPVIIAPFLGDPETIRQNLEACMVKHVCRIAIRTASDSFDLVLTLKVRF